MWHKGLLVKLSKVLPCWAVSVIELLLRQRRFRVHMGDISSSWRVQKNGLPQGSVLAPTLFNLYINDLPATCRKFIYADDICLAHQARKFEDLNTTINTDIAMISEFCKRWRLQPSVAKTVSSTFHLHNARINQELDIILNGKRLRHDNRPTYLGVTLDCTLTYKPHLRNVAAKTRTRNNLVHMLAGTTWGAGAKTLRTSALALCYSMAEYCAPVWRNSAHTNLVDVQLNNTMRTITGAVRCTRTDWLPVLMLRSNHLVQTVRTTFPAVQTVPFTFPLGISHSHLWRSGDGFSDSVCTAGKKMASLHRKPYRAIPW